MIERSASSTRHTDVREQQKYYETSTQKNVKFQNSSELKLVEWKTFFCLLSTFLSYSMWCGEENSSLWVLKLNLCQFFMLSGKIELEKIRKQNKKLLVRACFCSPSSSGISSSSGWMVFGFWWAPELRCERRNSKRKAKRSSLRKEKKIPVFSSLLTSNEATSWSFERFYFISILCISHKKAENYIYLHFFVKWKRKTWKIH